MTKLCIGTDYRWNKQTMPVVAGIIDCLERFAD